MRRFRFTPDVSRNGGLCYYFRFSRGCSNRNFTFWGSWRKAMFKNSICLLKIKSLTNVIKFKIIKSKNFNMKTWILRCDSWFLDAARKLFSVLTFLLRGRSFRFYKLRIRSFIWPGIPWCSTAFYTGPKKTGYNTFLRQKLTTPCHYEYCTNILNFKCP